MEQDHITISTDKQLLDLDFIHRELSESYWARSIPAAIVHRSIEHSLCFGVYAGGKQIGFARVISDYATFAYLADVFITAPQRGKGYSKQLMEYIMNHPQLQGLRRFLLATLDAHGLYSQYGFSSVQKPERLMEINRSGLYEQTEITR